MKRLQFHVMSDWNELTGLARKWNFYRINWQWILLEKTFFYTVVYKTFLYNPTNLKVPKKAPCWERAILCPNSLLKFEDSKHAWIYKKVDV